MTGMGPRANGVVEVFQHFTDIYALFLRNAKMAGAAGIEPAITGSKPGALPLGYAPIASGGPQHKSKPLGGQGGSAVLPPAVPIYPELP